MAVATGEDSDGCWSRIHAALAPRVAILSADDVDQLLIPNNLETFADLLKPFQNSVEDVAVRTSQLETRQCRTFPLTFEMLDALAPFSVASSSTDGGVFTPADVMAENGNGGPALQSPSAKARRRTKRYSRPEVLLDAISARISAKSKALWEVPRDGKGTRERQASMQSAIHHRRISSLYPRDAGMLLDDPEDDDPQTEAEGMERYRTAPIDELMPWFADMRDMVYGAAQISEHETFCHPLAIMSVVSASSPDPMNALANLFEASQPQSHAAFHMRPYVDPLVFRYYVVLHDIGKDGSDLTESMQLLENVKKTYGLHCCLLPINSAAQSAQKKEDDVSHVWQQALQDGNRGRHSRSESIESWHNEQQGVQDSDPIASRLRADDIVKIRAFVRDFAVQSLIPFMERCVSLWSEQLAASRKGLTGRLLGAGRKFFGGSRSANNSSTAASFAQLGFYPHTTVEAQTRRLADFAFMTRDYKLASSMYDYGRRDYAADRAYKFLAGANEMFGLSYLMMAAAGGKGQAIDVDSYLAAAGENYLMAPRQKGSALQINSLRATLLYYDAYQALHAYRMAPVALVRTANEGSSQAENDLEVVAAMLLEQAALSDIRKQGRAALRKCALHLMMAAHRYRTCGQKYLSLRCFQSSARCYRMLRNASSMPSQDSQPSNGEGEDEVVERIADIIARTEQTDVQHWDLIDDHMEYQTAQQAHNDGRFSQAVGHYMALLQRRRRIGAGDESGDNVSLHEAYLQGLTTSAKYLEGTLEEGMLANGLQPALLMVDAEQTCIEVNASTQIDDEPWRKFEESILGEAVSTSYKLRNTAAVGERFTVRLHLCNPLHTPVRLSGITVAMQQQSDTDVAKVSADQVHVEQISSLTLEPVETRVVSIGVSVDAPCSLRCDAVQYTLEGEVKMAERLTKKGKRLNATKEQRAAVQAQYAPHRSLLVEIHESKAILEAHIVNGPTTLGLGEEKAIAIRLVNVGKAPLRNLRLHVNRLDTLLASDAGLSEQSSEVVVENSLKTGQGQSIGLPANGELGAGEEMTWSAILRGSAFGVLTLRALFTYEPRAKGETLTAQLQHVLRVEPVIDLNVQAMPSRTQGLQYDLRIDAVSLLQNPNALVTIERVSLLAPLWTVEEIRQPANALQPLQDMPSGETRSMEFHVGPYQSGAELLDSRMAGLVNSLEVLLGAREKEISTTSLPLRVSAIDGDQQAAGAHRISPFLLAARRDYRAAMLAAEFPSLLQKDGAGCATDVIQRTFPLYEPRELDIIAHWRIVDETGNADRHGQAFVFGLGLGPLYDYLGPLFAAPADGQRGQSTRTMYAETEREKAAIWSDLRKSRLHVDEDPVMLDFVVPDQVHASPTSDGRRFTFDVEIRLGNLSSLDAHDVVVDLDNSGPPSTNATSGDRVHASYVGRLTHRTTIQPLASASVFATVSVPAAGSVSLSPVLVRSARATVDGKDRAWQHRRREFCPKKFAVQIASMGM